MWIVSIPQEVVVADDIERRFHGRFVTAEGDEEVAFEILSRAFGQIRKCCNFQNGDGGRPERNWAAKSQAARSNSLSMN
jgi:hypothetical protein